MASGNKNYDIATETKQNEVLSMAAKEATSQEILSKLASSGGGAKVENIKVAAGFTTNTRTTVLSITGKGKLYFALFVGKVTANSPGNIIVKIDGEIIANLSPVPPNYTPMCMAGILNPKFFNTVGVTKSKPLFPVSETYYDAFDIGDYPHIKYVNFSNEEQRFAPNKATSNYEESVLLFSLIDDYIPFENSLEVSIWGEDSQAKSGHVGYTLDE